MRRQRHPGAAKRVLANRRLYAQQIGRHDFTTPADLVAWLGAVQAQDYGAAKWALGLRLPEGATDAIIERAIAEGAILRTRAARDLATRDPEGRAVDAEARGSAPRGPVRDSPPAARAGRSDVQAKQRRTRESAARRKPSHAGRARHRAPQGADINRRSAARPPAGPGGGRRGDLQRGAEGEAVHLCASRSSVAGPTEAAGARRSEEHTSELQSQSNLVCRL